MDYTKYITLKNKVNISPPPPHSPHFKPAMKYIRGSAENFLVRPNRNSKTIFLVVQILETGSGQKIFNTVSQTHISAFYYEVTLKVPVLV